MAIFDFKCNNKKCKEYQNMIELIVKVEEKPLCEKCNKKLVREFPAPKGYVRGSDNPVRQ
jgi:transposase-like protein